MNKKLEILGGTVTVFLGTAGLIYYTHNFKLVPTLIVSAYSSLMAIPCMMSEDVKEKRKQITEENKAVFKKELVKTKELTR